MQTASDANMFPNVMHDRYNKSAFWTVESMPYMKYAAGEIIPSGGLQDATYYVDYSMYDQVRFCCFLHASLWRIYRLIFLADQRIRNSPSWGRERSSKAHDAHPNQRSCDARNTASQHCPLHQEVPSSPTDDVRDECQRLDCSWRFVWKYDEVPQLLSPEGHVPHDWPASNRGHDQQLQDLCNPFLERQCEFHACRCALDISIVCSILPWRKSQTQGRKTDGGCIVDLGRHIHGSCHRMERYSRHHHIGPRRPETCQHPVEQRGHFACCSHSNHLRAVAMGKLPRTRYSRS